MEHDPTLCFPSFDHPTAPVLCIGLELTDPYVEACWSSVVEPSTSRPLRRRSARWGVRLGVPRPAAQAAGHDACGPVPPRPVRQPEHIPGWPGDTGGWLPGDHLTPIDDSNRHLAYVVSISARFAGIQLDGDARLDSPTSRGPGIA